MQSLIQKHILTFTKGGLVNKSGELVGYRRTRHKRYIEDRYANWKFYKKRYNNHKVNKYDR